MVRKKSASGDCERTSSASAAGKGPRALSRTVEPKNVSEAVALSRTVEDNIVSEAAGSSTSEKLPRAVDTALDKALDKAVDKSPAVDGCTLVLIVRMPITSSVQPLHSAIAAERIIIIFFEESTQLCSLSYNYECGQSLSYITGMVLI